MPDKVTIDVVNTTEEFKWRLVVNGDASEWTSYYQGVLVHKGYFVVTDYWTPKFEAFVPYKFKKV